MTLKKPFRTILLVGLTLGMTAQGCVTADGERSEAEATKAEPPPEIYANMPLNKALEAGIDYGGDTLVAVKKLIKRRHEGDKAGQLMEDALVKGALTYEQHQLTNAGHLYASTPRPIAMRVFQALIESGRGIARQVGWQLAAMKPSTRMAQAVDMELTRAVAESDEDSILVPQMANAARANHLKGTYTLMLQGLLRKGDEEFAQAMITLDPKRATDDFMPYLAMANAEELRQLTMSSVNLYTCIAILKHQQSTPPSIGNLYFAHLFVYAVSRNTALAELAQSVLETQLPHNTELMAQALASEPVWVQIAYLGNARRNMNPKIGLLLTELKKTTAEQDVVQEIDEIKF